MRKLPKQYLGAFTTAQRDNLPSPILHIADLILNTTLNQYEYWDGSAWVPICGPDPPLGGMRVSNGEEGGFFEPTNTPTGIVWTNDEYNVGNIIRNNEKFTILKKGVWSIHTHLQAYNNGAQPDYIQLELYDLTNGKSLARSRLFLQVPVSYPADYFQMSLDLFDTEMIEANTDLEIRVWGNFATDLIAMGRQYWYASFVLESEIEP